MRRFLPPQLTLEHVLLQVALPPLPDSAAAVLYPSCAVALFYTVSKKCFVDPRPLELLLETGSKTKQNKKDFPHVLRWGCGSVGRELA